MSENLKLAQGLDIGTNKNAFIPTGAILFIGGDTYDATSPLTTGICPCDGREINRTDYALLFNIIGTTYGVGNGSTTFNVPNLKTASKIIAMKNSETLGTIGGSYQHGHTVNTNATGTTTSDGFDHGHSAGFGLSDGGSHYHYLGGAYMGMNSAAAHVGPGYKKDGPNSLASINHNHAMFFNALNMNYSGGHTHGTVYSHGTSTGTSHSHNYTTSGSVISADTLPPYVTALAYIKI